ncbi:MAG: lipid A deacylase LpxR family protein [Phycisphaerales bacterium]|nr:MAG: lipid A deacylase LpxR family protein [Phycisphaerales bacterium]
MSGYSPGPRSELFRARRGSARATTGPARGETGIGDATDGDQPLSRAAGRSRARPGVAACLSLALLAPPSATASGVWPGPTGLVARSTPDHAAAQTDTPSPLQQHLDAPHGPLRPVAFSIWWENDGAYVKPIAETDRHYTNGLKIDLGFRGGFLPDLMSALPGIGQFDNPRFAGGLSLTQLMYTGRDIRDPDPPRSDRPYAGHLGLTFYGQRSDRHKLDHVAIELGVLGPLSGAQAIQEFIHSAVPQQLKPRGWPKQLNDEPTINATWVRRWRTPRVSLGDLSGEIIPELGARLGTVRTGVETGATLRVGYNLPDDFGPPTRISGFRDVAGGWGDGSGNDWGLYAFGRVGATFKVHDVFLDGNVWSNSRSVDKRNVTGEIQIGLAGRLGKLDLGYAVTFTSREFNGQVGSDDYGTLFAAFQIEF